MHPSSFTFPQRSTNEQDAPLLDDPAQQQPTPTTASSLYSFPAYGVQPQPPYFQDYHPLQSAYNAPYPLELVAPTQQLPSELLEAGVASQATLHPTLDRRPSYQAPNELPSLLPSVSDGLQLDVDGAAAWQQEIGRAPPAGHETSFGALGLGFEQEHHHGQQQQYPPYPQQHYPPTLDYPAWAIQPPSKRRNSSRPASSSSGSQVASPIGSTHHPQWPLSPLTPADQAAQPQLHQRQWSGAFIPRSASLPHLHDYAQGYQAANYSYPSPYLAAGYASLQHSPNPSQHNLPLRASPLTDSQGSFSPYDQHPPPFHSPASSLAGKLALSSLSKIHTNTATQPRPPRPRPTPPPVDPNSPLVLLAQRNRQQYCTISSTSSTPASPHNNSGLKQPRAATTRKNLSEADAFCFVCRSLIGRVIMRGTEQQRNIEWHSGYECLKCVPPEERRDEDYEAVALSSNEVEGSAVYEATFSGALDRLEGLELEVVDERPPAGKALPAKKRKRLGAERELVACELLSRAPAIQEQLLIRFTRAVTGDVCTRDVARGELLKVGDDSPVDFYVELVCAVCTERYRRCTDCGGGGGPRLGSVVLARSRVGRS